MTYDYDSDYNYNYDYNFNYNFNYSYCDKGITCDLQPSYNHYKHNDVSLTSNIAYNSYLLPCKYK